MNKKEKNLLYGSNLWNFGDGMLGPLFAVFAERVGGDILDIAWAWAIYLMATGIFTIIIGKLSDRLNKARVMIAGYALTTIFTFSYLLVSSPFHLFLVQAGLGLALALCNPAWYALYDKYSDEKNDCYFWGLTDGQSKISTGLAVIVGGLIVNYFSFFVLFTTMGIVQTIATIYQAKILWLK